MGQLVPVAKISRPVAESAYPRTRLFERLDEARARPVVSVSGPPGCGKTTLLSSYLAARDVPSLWYQLDEGDTDVASFFYYLAQAARQLGTRRRAALPLLPREFQAQLAVFSRNFFRELYARFDGAGVLVLDNVADVAVGSDLEQVLRVALAEVPEGSNVILISRAEPRSVLAALLAQGRVASLGWDELKLSEDETRGIAASRSPDAKLAPALLRRLGSLSEGWVAGLVLMLERSMGAPLSEQRLELVDRDVVFDFFAGEVFERRSQTFQNFLLQTAFLPRITERLARCLTGYTESEGFLRELVSSNYFTVKHPGEPPSYEYHPLFREFLQQRARISLGAEALQTLQRRAAQLLLEEQDVESAAALFLATEDWEGVARLVCEHAPSLLEQGRRRTLLSWLERLPEEALRRDPWLEFWRGSALYPYDVEGSRAAFETAYWAFKHSADVTGAHLALVALIETYFYVLTDLRPLDGWLAELRELIQAHPQCPSPLVEIRRTYGMCSALMWREPASPELPLWVERAEQLIDTDVALGQRVLLGYALFLYYVRWKGDVPGSAMSMDKIRHMLRRGGSTPYARLLWKMVQATYAWISNDPDEGLRAVRSGLSIANKSGVHVFDLILTGLGVYCHMVQGDVEGAHRELERMRELQYDGSNGSQSHYHYLAAWVALGRGELGRAREHAVLALRYTDEADATITHTYHQVTLAQVCLESGELEQAGRLLASAWRDAHRMGNGYIEYGCMLAKAQRLLALPGRRERALRALSRALAFGRRHGYIAHPGIGWRHEVLAKLLQVALEHDIEVAYVRRLIEARQLKAAAPPMDVAAWPWPIRIEILAEPRISVGGQTVRAGGKTLELIRVLASSGMGRTLNAGTVADTLWPEADGDAAYHSLETTLYRLRKLLGSATAVEFQERRVRLDPSYCWVDVWAVEHLLRRLESALDARGESDELRHLSGRLFALFPPVDPEATDTGGGVVADLRQQLVHAVERLGQHWVAQEQWGEAIACYRKALRIHPAGEGLYQELMRCYAHLGRRAELLQTYEGCREQLALALGTEPSRQTTELLRGLLARLDALDQRECKEL